KLANRRRIGVIAKVHLRKSPADDPYDEINASTGLAAVADNMVILKRERGQADASLIGTGREIEDLDMALSFSNGFWSYLGSGFAYRISKEHKEVLDMLEQAGKPL